MIIPKFTSVKEREILKRFLNIAVGWLLFALYLTLLCAIPFFILGNNWGGLIGITIAATILISLRFGAEKKVFARLSLKSLSIAESPETFHISEEFCRRLNIPEPQIAILKSDALNVGVFGLSRKHTLLILTDKLLTSVSRPQLAALIGRQLTAVYYGDTALSSWLVRFLSCLETLSIPSSFSKSKGLYSLRWVIARMIFLPLAILPEKFLLRIRHRINLDLESLKLTQLPTALAESYRLLEAASARNTLKAPASLSPIFLMPPQQSDPISKIIISQTNHSRLLKSLNGLEHYK